MKKSEMIKSPSPPTLHSLTTFDRLDTTRLQKH